MENVTDVRNYNVEVEVIEEKTTIIEVTEYLLLVLLVACLMTVRTVEYLLFVALIILSRIICNCGGCKFVTKCPIL